MRILLTTAALVLCLATGCGGDDADPAADSPSPSTSPSASESAAPESGLTVTAGITSGELLDCLIGAGLDATLKDTVPFGVDVPSEGIEVTGMTDYEGDPDQGASLYVFADPAAATANASVLTLGGSDDPTNDRFGVHGNVVRVMDIILKPGTHTDDENALLGCLPA
jgi:hypothetical protein